MVVDALLSRGEFFTAYTPYQAEIAQGTLQAMFEFQTLMTQLTGQEVSNASLYDGSTATTEAALMAMRVTRRSRVLVARTLHPEYRQMLRDLRPATRTWNWWKSPTTASGQIDVAQLESALDAETAAVVVQSPNFFGALERMPEIAAVAHGSGALLIVTHHRAALAGGRQASQRGGHRLRRGAIVRRAGGFRRSLRWLPDHPGEVPRQMPGRLVGQTVDTEGRRGFVLTLATREQHIRREKATSNICTNQSLCALAATIYLCLLGKTDCGSWPSRIWPRLITLPGNLRRFPGVDRAFRGPAFNEFVVKVPGDAERSAGGIAAGKDHRRPAFGSDSIRNCEPPAGLLHRNGEPGGD